MAMMLDAPLSWNATAATEQGHPSARLILTAITIRLGAEASRKIAELRQELVLGALAEALLADTTNAPTAWTVQPVPEGDPLLYRLTPLLDCRIPSQSAWEMIYVLRAQPQIAKAEPTFVSWHTADR